MTDAKSPANQSIQHRRDGMSIDTKELKERIYALEADLDTAQHADHEETIRALVVAADHLEALMEALMPAREALADLDKSHYRVAKKVAKQDPGGYVMGNVSVVSLVTVIESTRKALALLDGEKGGEA